MLSKRVISGVESRNDETPPIATPTTARSTVYGRWSRSAAGWTTLARTRNPAMTKVMLATLINCRFRRACQGVTTGDGPRHARFYEPLFRLNYVALPPRPKPARRRSAPMSWRTISLRLRGRVGTRSCCGSNSAGRPMGKSANTSPPFARTRARARGGSENQRPWPADKVERWSIDRLIPYAKNARTHTDAQVAAIAASIKEWGWTTPALVGEDGGLIAGHARLLAARQLGIAEIPVMVAAGWSEAQKRAYVLADNQLAITGSGWDPELLRLELGELKLSGFDLSLTGFGDLELKDIMAERTEGLTDPDDVPPVPEHPVSQTGDLWLLGRHRLLCGDSTGATGGERGLGGVAPHLMVTDPPYGVAYDAGWRATAKITRRRTDGGPPEIMGGRAL